MNRRALNDLKSFIAQHSDPINMIRWDTCAMGLYWQATDTFPTDLALMTIGGRQLVEAQFAITPEQARWIVNPDAYSTLKAHPSEVIEHIDDVLYGADIALRWNAACYRHTTAHE